MSILERRLKELVDAVSLENSHRKAVNMPPFFGEESVPPIPEPPVMDSVVAAKAYITTLRLLSASPEGTSMDVEDSYGALEMAMRRNNVRDHHMLEAWNLLEVRRMMEG